MGPDLSAPRAVDEDDLPLAQRLLILQKKRAEQLAAASARGEHGSLSATQEPSNGARGKALPAKIKADPNFVSAVQKRLGEASGSAKSHSVKVKSDPGKRADPAGRDESPENGTDRKEKKIKIKADPGEHKPAKNEVKSKEEGEGEDTADEEYRWWEEGNNDGSVKWTTLEHNGVYFAPPYEPHGVQMLYDGQAVDLEREGEEVASFFAALVGTDHYENETFRANFFEDFREVLHSTNSKWRHVITSLEKCDFGPIARYLNLVREEKRSMSKEDKEKIKTEKAKIDEVYGWCLLDGRKEKVGNFRVEPPGLFRGRGKHPRTGKLKTRVVPEQVTINIGEDTKVPDPPPGHSWGKIVHDNTVTWLANWTENINKAPKYVFLAPGSSLKGQSDLRKFEVARELKKHVYRIRQTSGVELHSKDMMIRQRATALWLIDRLALRAGNEKGDDEADTVGCCSLRCEHVKLRQRERVVFDFLGKDSIRYYNEVVVEPIIHKNLAIFMQKPKTKTDLIFDRLTTTSLNKYLNGLMPGLSAKVFRTYNASHTFQVELAKTPKEGSVHDLILSYNRANRQVAVLCNHQRSVPKTHQTSMQKLSEKITDMKYQRHLVRKSLREMMSREELQEECPQALQDESDMDEETIARKALEETAASQKQGEGEEQDGGRSTNDSPTKRSKQPSRESLQKKLAALTLRIQAAKNQRIDRDENKTTALGTSKTNYIDPRITAAWCQQHGVPLEKLFNKTLREKFKWAMTVSKDWRF